MKISKEEKTKLKEFEAKLGVTFNNQLLLKEALIHRSFLNEQRDPSLSNNERLEYLGDAVLELIVSEYLFEQYPNRPEGDLTSFRAAIVRTDSLAETSDELEYNDYLYMSKGEEATGGRNRPYILANTFESVLGAIYLDQGYDVAKVFVTKNLLPKLKRIVEQRLDIDNKSKLQALAQEVLKETPTYNVIDEKGPDHDKEFKIEVIIGHKSYGKGVGKNKQEAEQNAAQKALEDWAKK